MAALKARPALAARSAGETGDGMGHLAATRMSAARYRRRLMLSTALATVLVLGIADQPAEAQSVTAGGDVIPFPSPNPLPTWITNSDLLLGQTGIGTLTIADGGTVSNLTGAVGVNSGFAGTVTVTGPGSTWTNSRELTVGLYDSATGTVTIDAGGKVTSAMGRV